MTLGNLILQYCNENGITSTQFAKKSGINRSYIFVLKKVRTPGMQTIKKAARAMGMSFEEVTDMIDINLPKNLQTNLAKEIPLYSAMPLTDENIIGNVAVLSDEADVCFGYRIADNDMSPFIFKNAIVIAKAEKSIPNNSVVIASADGKTFCRSYLKTKDGIYLTPINPKSDTLFFDKNQNKTKLIIHGIVSEVRFPI